MAHLRGVCVGAGYFSQFHYDAWGRIGDVAITGLCDLDREKAAACAREHGIPKTYGDFTEMLDTERPDFVDVITPPATHLELCRRAAERGIHVICQKPLAPTIDEAAEIVRVTQEKGVRFMAHDNFRFQPWHREIRKLIDDGAIGGTVHSLTFRSRPGDGWGDDAYLSRQPYFRDMPRFLIFETGVHFIDVFRFLAGEVVRVYCILRQLNPVIAGEDCGILIHTFESGAVGIWDANRWNESNTDDPRYTFGEFLVEGDGGAIRLYPDGRLTLQPLGEKEREHPYEQSRRGFGGDCVHATLRHFVERLRDGDPFETEGAEYLKTLRVQEAFYESGRRGRPIALPPAK